ncbi:MAG: PDZ domain-containing protein [candidate division Zixibacteria bacterium]|nr:PDZ domain-containing protein [candidate division Zixibacteria bacterium]
MFLIILLAGAAGVFILSDKGLRQALVFVNFTVQLEETYPGQLDWDRLYISARDAMFEQLDHYSGFIETDQFEQLDEELSGSYSGIGVSVVRHDRGLLIMSVRENSPAAEVGLLSGDIIIEAEDVLLAGMTSDKSTRLLRGPEGTSVKVAVFRPVLEDTLTVDITRRKVDLLHVPFAGYTPDSIIYIRVLDFEAGTTDDIEAALDSLLTKESIKPRGVILDLKGNPGGLFVEAYHTANLFLEKGRFIVGTDGRSRWKEEKYYSTGRDITAGLPLAVILDGGSASSAEIVSGALKQLDRAVLIGDTTFGKGLVQGFTRFPDGSGVRLTISRYYLEGGVYLNEFDTALNEVGSGLAPDFYYRFNERALFPRLLENSLLLQQFANLHQEEIIAQSENFNLADSWLDRFKAYARENNFIYISPETDLARLLVELSRFESASPETRKAADKILDIARKNDIDKFDEYGGYIKMRLRQTAVERKFGTYRAYADVIVRSRPDIQLAARILKEKR